MTWLKLVRQLRSRLTVQRFPILPLTLYYLAGQDFSGSPSGQDCFFSDMTSSGVIVTLMPGAGYSHMWLSDELNLHLMGIAFLQQSLKSALTPPFGT